MAIDVNALLAPIRDDAPSGDDASFSDLFDRIRDARRADDTSLSQGDWQSELKTADWRLALELSSDALLRVSKDLQAAAWFAEALIARHGLEGARDGFTVIAGLVERYWDTVHPLAEDGDLEERAGRLAWFDTNAAAALRRMPLNDDPAAPVTLNDWQGSREVDNLGRQNAEAYQAALAEGRQTGESVDARLRATADDALRTAVVSSAAAQAAFVHMKSAVDARFGREAPGFSALDDTLKRVQQVLQTTAKAKGLLEPAAAAAVMDEAPAGTSVAAGAPAAARAAVGGAALDLSGNGQASKQAALKALGEIAEYFRRNEPHSPVSSLLDQAVRWADLSLADFLAEVVRDDSTLDAIRARVGLAR
ncbi:MAG TPA: type VI secretion system protein TssA [Luteimonas sp.]|nr:type VI secretion system protein TssA [Luteimonas sp.]